MRRFLLSLLIISSAPALAACGDDPKPMFLVLNYQVSCRNTGGCSGIPARQIDTLNGETGNTISCRLAETGGQFLFNMSFDHPSMDPLEDYGFAIQNAVVGAGGGPATAGNIEITEQSNRYSGRAGGSPPSATCGDDPPTSCPIPCRLFEITFEETVNGPAVRGKVQCEGLPLALDSMITREIHFPTASTEPADFLVENCEGL